MHRTDDVCLSSCCFFLEALGTGDLDWLQVHQVQLLLKKITFLAVLLHN